MKRFLVSGMAAMFLSASSGLALAQDTTTLTTVTTPVDGTATPVATPGAHKHHHHKKADDSGAAADAAPTPAS
jgi:hypothetical protein